MFILAQILSFLGMVINMVAVQLKTKKQILLTIVISNILFVISYILLGAYVGALTCGITAVEIVINTILENKGKKTPKALIIVYLLISISIGILTWGNIVDLLPIIASILFIPTLIQAKERYVRLLILGNLIAWGSYDVIVRAYSAAISDLFVITSTVTAIYRYDIKKKEKKDETN